MFLKMIRILAVDDHALLRKGLAAVMNAEPDMKLVAEASNGEDGIEQFRIHRPDIVLMDLQMPGLNGIEATARILSEFPDARIIVLTTYHGDVQVMRALRAGARAYLIERTRSGTYRDDSCRPSRKKDNPSGDCQRTR